MKPLTRHGAAGMILGLGLAIAGAAHAAPAVAISGVSDASLRGLLEQAVSEAGGPPRDALDARRRAAEAARNAVALLRSEGYYEGEATVDPVQAAQAKVAIRVVAGPRFALRAASLQWTGAPPDEASRAAATKALALAAGAPGRAADIIAAEGRAVAALHRLGYPDAQIRPRQVVVDHADRSVTPTLRLAAGPRVRLGALRLAAGHDRTRVRWLNSLATWKAGAVYDPALLAKLEKRLVETGVYEAATVDLAPAAAGEGTQAQRDVLVSLVPRKPRTIELGAGYSTTEGSGVDAKWTRYNRLGLGDSLILTTKLYDIQQRLDLEQDLPDWLRPDQTLKIGGGFLGDRTPAYDDLGGGMRIDVVRHYDRTTSFTLGAAFDYASTREKVAVNTQGLPVGETLNLYITTLTGAVTLDRTNSILDPSRGWRLSLQADPTWVAGDRSLEYVKTEAQVSGYLPTFSGGPVLAARLRLGSILGGTIPDVPADRRFFAGGGGSVRGYGYQAVGPQLSDGTPVGGVSLTEGSFEVRQPLGSRWGLVAFADAGALGQTATPKFDGLAVGAGLGVRYDLGFGPLRLDLGTPLNPRPGDSRIQVYISIGQAF